MTHEPVSTPYPLHQAARTSGRAPAVQHQLPELDAEGARVLSTLEQPLTEAALREWVERLVDQPTRAGAQVLAYLAEVYRASARDRNVGEADGELAAADAFAKLSQAVSRAVDTKEALAELAVAFSESLRETLAVGVAAGRHDLEQELAADATRPVLERHVEFVLDSKDRVVGKIEREYKKTGGKNDR